MSYERSVRALRTIILSLPLLAGGVHSWALLCNAGRSSDHGYPTQRSARRWVVDQRRLGQMVYVTRIAHCVRSGMLVAPTM